MAALELVVTYAQVQDATRALEQLATKGGMAGDMARKLQSDFKSGAISADQFQSAAVKIAPATASATVGTNSLADAFQRMKQAAAQGGANAMAAQIQKLDQFQNQAVVSGAAAAQGFGKIQQGLLGVATSTLALNPQLSRLGASIGMFGIGGPWMLAITGGLAVAGLAMQAFKDSTKEADEALKSAVDHANQLLTSAAGKAMFEAGSLAIAQTELEEKRALIEKNARALGGESAVKSLQIQQKIADITDVITQKDIKRLALLKLHANVIVDQQNALTIASAEHEASWDRLNSRLTKAEELYQSLATWSKIIMAPGSGYAAVLAGQQQWRPQTSRGNALADNFERDLLAAFQRLKIPLENALTDLETDALRGLHQGFTSLFEEVATNGIRSFERLFGSIRQMFTKLVADVAAQKLMEKITARNAAGVAALPGLGAALPWVGAVLALGAITEAMDNAGEAARLAAERLREAKKAQDDFSSSLTVAGGGLAGALASVEMEMAQRRAEAQKLFTGAALIEQLQRITDLEAQQIANLQLEVYWRQQHLKEDLEVRALRATGRGPEADDAAFRNQQEREYLQAFRDGLGDVYLARLLEVQAMEATRRATDLLIVAREREVDAAKAALARTTETVNSLRAFADQLRGSSGSPVQNLDFARQQFAKVSALAQGGDQAAAMRLPELGQQLLELSRQYNASGMGYQTDLQYVLGIVDSLGDRFDVQRNLEQMAYDALLAILNELKGIRQITIPGGGGPLEIVPGTAGAVAMQQAGLRGVIAELQTLNAKTDENTTAIKRLGESQKLGVV